MEIFSQGLEFLTLWAISQIYKTFLSISHFFRNLSRSRREERKILGAKYSIQDMQAIPTVRKALKTTAVIAIGAVAAVSSYFVRRFHS
jgi:hypothetical protein